MRKEKLLLLLFVSLLTLPVILSQQGPTSRVYLCQNQLNIGTHFQSFEELATNCGPTTKTICIDGKEEVYFKDSCGNLANIYDASRSDDETYWAKTISKPESCNPDSGNANSATCGNCDYFLGSTCKEYSRAKDARVPKLGDYICRDLSCTYEGQRYEHGETWCANSKGINENLPGSRYFRLVCYNGDVTVEPCADERKEVCLQGSVNGFSSAVCSSRSPIQSTLCSKSLMYLPSSARSSGNSLKKAANSSGVLLSLII